MTCSLKTEKDHHYKSYYIQEQIDMACYNYDANESFGNIDVTSCTEEFLSNDKTSSESIKSNRQKVFLSAIKDKGNKDKHEELDRLLDTMDAETDKISNTLSDIQTHMSSSKELKSAIEDSIAKLYQNMKYANEKLPFFQNQSSWDLGNLEKHKGITLDSQATINAVTERCLTPSKHHHKSSSNTSNQKGLMVERNNIGK